MKLLDGLDGLRQVTRGGVLSVGNFDGMHLGHRRLLEVAEGLRARSSGKLAVVTFEPHPLTVLRPELAPPRLTGAGVKQRLLEVAGVDEYVVLPPSGEVLNLSAEAFWGILRDEVRPAHLIEGSSFTFGKGRGGTIDRLRDWAAGSAIQLHVVDGVTMPLLDLSVVPVSSSLIRWLLAQGRARDAAICLGRAYALRGEVVEGFKRGRQLGVPTANLRCEDQLVPGDGVYAGRCTVAGESGTGNLPVSSNEKHGRVARATYAVALSIGTLPTFGEQIRRQVEAHLIGFNGDLYGRTIEVEILDWVREQRKFAGVEALKKQIARDIHVASEPIGDPARAIAQVG